VDQDEADAIEEGFRVCAKYRSGDALEDRHWNLRANPTILKYT